MKLNVELELTLTGIKVNGPAADRYLAKNELRRRRMTVI